MIEWATSVAGIRTQAVLAMVCQIVGFFIVVMEIVEARSDFRRLVRRFGEFDQQMISDYHAMIDSDAIETRIKTSIESAGESLGPRLKQALVELLKAPAEANMPLINSLLSKIHEVAELNNDTRAHPWRPWVGAGFLLLGIMFSFTGQMLGVK